MPNKILVLEGEWEQNPKFRVSVEAAMRLLADVCDRVYHHRRIGTREEFFFQLQKARYKDYSIIYLAFHGSPGYIQLGDKDHLLTLDEIADSCQELLSQKIVHFGSCSTLDLDRESLETFKTQTKAKHVSGYTKDVDFIDSALFDIAYFDWLEEYEKKSYVDRRLEKEYPGLYERLGFVMV